MNQREIKFRAWDIARKIMRYGVDIKNTIRDGARACHATPNSFLIYYAKPEDEIIMQYTGLKTDKGEEIYEGDIITCQATQREINDVIDKDEKVIVKYSNGYYYPFGYNAGWRSSVDFIEKLGNIYENPELLK